MSEMKKLRLVDPTTKEDLVMLLYKALGERKNIGYSEMHKYAKAFQDFLENNYGITLGYEFQDNSVFEIWDAKFQEDIEMYDAMGRVIKNSDKLVPGTTDYYSHELKIRPEGDFLLKTSSKLNLERQEIKVDQLIKEIRKIRP